jgi:hypothetical protein
MSFPHHVSPSIVTIALYFSFIATVGLVNCTCVYVSDCTALAPSSWTCTNSVQAQLLSHQRKELCWRITFTIVFILRGSHLPFLALLPIQKYFAFLYASVPIPVAARSKGLRPLVYYDCGFESRRGHGCLSLVSVVCCQVEVSATGWSLVQRSPTECGVSKKCVIVKPRKMRPKPRSCRAIGEK